MRDKNHLLFQNITKNISLTYYLKVLQVLFCNFLIYTSLLICRNFSFSC